MISVVAAATAVGFGTAEGAEHHHEAEISAPTPEGWKLSADSKFRCGTCQFWGGMRKVTDDRKQVVAVSLGWCNNPASPMYSKLTAPVHEMTEAGVWTKWGALP
jgi:hypothetical protein